MQEFFKYTSSKNIKVTFESQHMASQVQGTKALLLFNLHTRHTISARKFSSKFLFASNVTSSKITPHRHAQSQRIIKYAHYVPLLNTHTVNALPGIGCVLTARKVTIIALLL